MKEWKLIVGMSIVLTLAFHGQSLAYPMLTPDTSLGIVRSDTNLVIVFGRPDELDTAKNFGTTISVADLEETTYEVKNSNEQLDENSLIELSCSSSVAPMQALDTLPEMEASLVSQQHLYAGDERLSQVTMSTEPVPEPSTMGLMGLGLVIAWVLARRKRKKHA